MTTIAIIAAGAMGAAIGRRLVQAGCTVLTHLDGRSEATKKRATEAGMQDASYAKIASEASWVLSILPPSDALAFAEKFLRESVTERRRGRTRTEPLAFADCNAVNPTTVKRISELFTLASPPIPFVDAGIIGGPPTEGYDPTIYASADDGDLLRRFASLSQYSLKISALQGEGVSVGDASALKMSYAGITKGTTGIFTTMILAAHAASPATAQALSHELHNSQPELLRRITKVVPPMIPKAYRWVGEMEEIGDFVGVGQGDTYRGIAKTYERITGSLKDDGRDVELLKKFVEDAKDL